MMKYEVKDLSSVEHEIHFSPEPDELKRERERVAAQMAMTISVPGFRKGKVPASVVLSRHSDDVDQASVEAIVHKEVPPIVQKMGWKVMEFGLYIKNAGDTKKVIQDDGRIVVLLECLPEAEVHIPAIKLESEDVSVTEEEIGDSLEIIRKQMAELKPVEMPRPGQVGDVLMLKAVDPKQDAPAAGAEKQEESGDDQESLFWYEIQAPQKNEADPLLGMNVGEIRSLEMPTDDSAKAQDQSSLPTRNFICRSVNVRVLPELNDDFAKKAGKLDSLSALRSHVTHVLKQQKRQGIADKNYNLIINEMVKANDLPYPAGLYRRVYSEQINRFLNNLESRGTKITEHQVTEFVDKNKEALKDVADKMAKFEVITALYANKANINVTNKEVDELYQTLNSKQKNADGLSEEGRFRLKCVMLREKVLMDIKAKSVN